ncbi:nitrogen fixation protein [Nostoc paludosum FACHB-159]|uniref:Nitrogen fixation protein n=1 Tax=Nostoc paludosum FACHB-159 TaxID=2692908 RepID=A0ABR8KG86_9NOSO|nr:nitrogen fixation protein [Nostoc sp. FACHB-857]MBD2738559.1 nitrogen fixation protein [Nostoc paludosum FACHB-159]
MDSVKLPLCPSGQPKIGDTVVFGVVGGTVEAASITYLKESQPVTEEILALSGPVKPTEIFRIASSCQANACQHFDGANCRLAMRIVEQLPTVVETLPACQIRSSCRWWQQEGKAACYRCPQIVTNNSYSSQILHEVASDRSFPKVRKQTSKQIR